VDPVAQLRAAVVRALALQPSGRWLVGSSGGPDSTTLVDALEADGSRELHVVAVDHGLRQKAASEAATVVAAARARGLSAAAIRVTVDGKSMAAARRARYDALVAEARRVGAVAIAVAHTATDQAETLLDRLLRGAGTRGLSAMAPARRIDGDLWLVRPLLGVTRAEVEAYVAARALVVVRDPTNADLAYRRSRVRHELLPLLRRERPDLDRALAATCDRLRADADALDEAAAAAAARLADVDGSLDAIALAGLPEALFARIVTRASGLALAAVHIAALRTLCATANGTRSLDLPARVRAERQYARLRFSTRVEKVASDVTPEVAVGQPGIYLLDEMRVEVSAQLYESLGDEPLTLRHVRAGDRVRNGKLQDVLVNAKVPRPERARLPVLARGARVVWIPGVRVQ
jgi:tRNA(Ile)-lysidine synthase